jgi:hypothetical protein
VTGRRSPICVRMFLGTTRLSVTSSAFSSREAGGALDYDQSAGRFQWFSTRTMNRQAALCAIAAYSTCTGTSTGTTPDVASDAHITEQSIGESALGAGRWSRGTRPACSCTRDHVFVALARSRCGAHTSSRWYEHRSNKNVTPAIQRFRPRSSIRLASRLADDCPLLVQTRVSGEI